jgi:hypothetical protein
MRKGLLRVWIVYAVLAVPAVLYAVWEDHWAKWYEFGQRTRFYAYVPSPPDSPRLTPWRNEDEAYNAAQRYGEAAFLAMGEGVAVWIPLVKRAGGDLIPAKDAKGLTAYLPALSREEDTLKQELLGIAALDKKLRRGEIAATHFPRDLLVLFAVLVLLPALLTGAVWFLVRVYRWVLTGFREGKEDASA